MMQNLAAALLEVVLRTKIEAEKRGAQALAKNVTYYFVN